MPMPPPSSLPARSNPSTSVSRSMRQRLYLPFSQPGSQLLFQLISKLYENTSLLITDHHQSRLRRLAATSAMCTHIGCHLHWNSFETCWDCPCHGSQFAVDGTALNAPAIRALDEVKTEE